MLLERVRASPIPETPESGTQTFEPRASADHFPRSALPSDIRGHACHLLCPHLSGVLTLRSVGLGMSQGRPTQSWDLPRGGDGVVHGSKWYGNGGGRSEGPAVGEHRTERSGDGIDGAHRGVRGGEGTSHEGERAASAACLQYESTEVGLDGPPDAWCLRLGVL